jgi:prephenate dehydrogenase
MVVQITIIGLGQIGASIGLALAGHSQLVRRVGHDKDLAIARRAEKMGALDQVRLNLPSAVREADVALLCLPIDQIHETLAILAPDLKPGAVVIDTGPVKEVVAGWARELLQQSNHYIGLTPVINPVYLHEVDSGLDAAHADLFRGGRMAIVSPPEASSEAIKLAADLTRLLGATPLFADPVEMDGLMAATHILPQLVAAALLNATVDQPGWMEGRKVAGRAYAEVTGPVLHPTEPMTLREAALLNRENVIRVMDGMIATLQAIRSDVYHGDGEALDERLARARSGREDWWKQRQSEEWSGEGAPSATAPPASEWFGRLLAIGGKKKK